MIIFVVPVFFKVQSFTQRTGKALAGLDEYNDVLVFGVLKPRAKTLLEPFMVEVQNMVASG